MSGSLRPSVFYISLGSFIVFWLMIFAYYCLRLGPDASNCLLYIAFLNSFLFFVTQTCLYTVKVNFWFKKIVNDPKPKNTYENLPIILDRNRDARIVLFSILLITLVFIVIEIAFINHPFANLKLVALRIAFATLMDLFAGVCCFLLILSYPNILKYRKSN